MQNKAQCCLQTIVQVYESSQWIVVACNVTLQYEATLICSEFKKVHWITRLQRTVFQTGNWSYRSVNGSYSSSGPAVAKLKSINRKVLMLCCQRSYLFYRRVPCTFIHAPHLVLNAWHLLRWHFEFWINYHRQMSSHTLMKLITAISLSASCSTFWLLTWLVETSSSWLQTLVAEFAFSEQKVRATSAADLASVLGFGPQLSVACQKLTVS